MMGRQAADQRQLFYEFNLDERVPANHLNATKPVLPHDARACATAVSGGQEAVDLGRVEEVFRPLMAVRNRLTLYFSRIGHAFRPCGFIGLRDAKHSRLATEHAICKEFLSMAG